jgi:hypothetical protein
MTEQTGTYCRLTPRSRVDTPKNGVPLNANVRPTDTFVCR